MFGIFQPQLGWIFVSFHNRGRDWIHHSSPVQSKRSLGQIGTEEEQEKCVSQQNCATVFWDRRGIIFINYLPKKRSINDRHTNLLDLKKKTSRQCKGVHVRYGYGEVQWTWLWIAPSSTIFSGLVTSDSFGTCSNGPAEGDLAAIYNLSLKLTTVLRFSTNHVIWEDSPSV